MWHHRHTEQNIYEQSTDISYSGTEIILEGKRISIIDEITLMSSKLDSYS